MSYAPKGNGSTAEHRESNGDFQSDGGVSVAAPGYVHDRGASVILHRLGVTIHSF